MHQELSLSSSLGMFYHLPKWLFGSNTSLFHLDCSFYFSLIYKAVSLQTSLQDLQVVLQHGAAGWARSRPGALHHPVVAGGALCLRRRLPAGWRGAGEARAQQRLLWLIGWKSMVVTMITASVRLKPDKVRTIKQKPRSGSGKMWLLQHWSAGTVF